jgi:hypothetical protein
LGGGCGYLHNLDNRGAIIDKKITTAFEPMYLDFLTMTWLASLTQLQETCLTTSFSTMAALLMLTLNTTGKICVNNGTHSTLYNPYSSRFRIALITQRQGGSPSVRHKSSRLRTPKSLQLESSTVFAAVGMTYFLQSRLGMLLKLTLQLPTSSTSKFKGKQQLPQGMPTQL